MRKAFLVLWFMSFPGLCFGAITHLQTLDSTTASDAGTTQTRSVTWTAGSLGIIWTAGWISGGAPTIDSCIGSSSGTWSCPASLQVAGSNRREAICYKENITTGADTVTVTWSGSLGSGRIAASEYSGVHATSPLVHAVAYVTSSSNTAPSINLRSEYAGSLFLAFIHPLGDMTITPAETGRSEVETFIAVNAQDYIGTGSKDMAWTIGSSVASHLVGAVFKPTEATAGVVGNVTATQGAGGNITITQGAGGNVTLTAG